MKRLIGISLGAMALASSQVSAQDGEVARLEAEYLRAYVTPLGVRGEIDFDPNQIPNASNGSVFDDGTSFLLTDSVIDVGCSDIVIGGSGQDGSLGLALPNEEISTVLVDVTIVSFCD
ncbi:hypothetical protein [Parvularcula marina]|uniref:Uncharacterized protein n=1 Tax=Parvularcula marina TaxID=2292771 RepID=A0A371R7I9_9PROT|nr:hypothetical protein [Parvularcula marina]RFB01421.1 hypothetical protein DX908_14105 [Parvularcula marina]